MSEKYRFIEDPGHGWLEVPLQELQELRIIDEISGYSYVSADRQTVYLEEDCDLTTFANAHMDKYPLDGEETRGDWFEKNLFTEYQENTFVRNLNQYSPQAA